MRKPKSLLLKAVETGVRYEDAIRLHGIMRTTIDEERNIQAGKVYDLAKQFREEIAALEPHVDDLIAQNQAFRSLLMALGPVLKSAAEADAGVSEAVAALEELLGEDGFGPELDEDVPVPSPVAAKPAQEPASPPAQTAFDL